MASVLIKNSPAKSVIRYQMATDSLYAFPIENLYGVTSATGAGAAGESMSSAWQTLTFTTAANALGLKVGSQFIFGTPTVPDFTVGAGDATFDFEITGWDHFGEPIVETGSKVQTSVVVCRCYRAFSVITSVRVRQTGGTATTVSLGHNQTTTNHTIKRIPLPYRLSSSVYAQGIQIATIGGQTIGAGLAANAHSQIIGGASDTANADSITAVTSVLVGLRDNARLWTPNRLAQVGVAAVVMGNYTSVAAGAPVMLRRLMTPSAFVDQQ